MGEERRKETLGGLGVRDGKDEKRGVVSSLFFIWKISSYRKLFPLDLTSKKQ